MRVTFSEIAGGPLDPPPPLVKGVGTKRLGKGRVNPRMLTDQAVVEESKSFIQPGDFRSWKSPQTLPALFIGHFEHVERFRNLKFAVKGITNIQSTVLSSSESTAAIHFTFK